MIVLTYLIEALILTLALSLDAFVTGFAYGNEKIRISLLISLIINILSSGILLISLLIGNLISIFLPFGITTLVSIIILIILGTFKIFDKQLKLLIQKVKNAFKNTKINLILNVYTNQKCADLDSSKSLSVLEATILAITLSFDSLTVGLGAGLNNLLVLQIFLIILSSLFTGFIFLSSGHLIGKRLAYKTSINLSWLSGLVLIGLALSKLLF